MIRLLFYDTLNTIVHQFLLFINFVKAFCSLTENFSHTCIHRSLENNGMNKILLSFYATILFVHQLNHSKCSFPASKLTGIQLTEKDTSPKLLFESLKKESA